jgi:hypothetical protein
MDARGKACLAPDPLRGVARGSSANAIHFLRFSYPTQPNKALLWGNLLQVESGNRAPTGGHVTKPNNGGIRKKLPPETLLDTDQRRLIRAGVACMHDINPIRAYVACVNQHQRLGRVLRLPVRRAVTLPEDR